MIGVVQLAPCFLELVEPFWLRAHFPWLRISAWAKGGRDGRGGDCTSVGIVPALSAYIKLYGASVRTCAMRVTIVELP